MKHCNQCGIVLVTFNKIELCNGCIKLEEEYKLQEGNGAMDPKKVVDYINKLVPSKKRQHQWTVYDLVTILNLKVWQQKEKESNCYE